MLHRFGSNATVFEYQVVAVSMEIWDPGSTSIQEQLLVKTPTYNEEMSLKNLLLPKKGLANIAGILQ